MVSSSYLANHYWLTYYAQSLYLSQPHQTHSGARLRLRCFVAIFQFYFSKYTVHPG